jgi:hypothetical protein
MAAARLWTGPPCACPGVFNLLAAMKRCVFGAFFFGVGSPQSWGDHGLPHTAVLLSQSPVARSSSPAPSPLILLGCMLSSHSFS